MAISGWIKFIKFQAGASLMTAIMAVGLIYLTATLLRWLVHLVRSVKSRDEVRSLSFLPPATPLPT